MVSSDTAARTVRRVGSLAGPHHLSVMAGGRGFDYVCSAVCSVSATLALGAEKRNHLHRTLIAMGLKIFRLYLKIESVNTRGRCRDGAREEMLGDKNCQSADSERSKQSF